MWQHPTSGSDKINGARISTAGVVQDKPSVAISSILGFGKGYPDVACDGKGGCLVVWMMGPNATTREINGVITQNSSSTGLKVVSSADIVINKTSIPSWFPAVAYSGSDYLVVWEYGGYTSANIAGTRVSKAGKVSTAALLNVSLGSGRQTYPAVARGPGIFLVGWKDQRTDAKGDIYATRVGP